MARFQVVHPHEQGQDIIIVLVDQSFGYKLNMEQNHIRASIQAFATAAGPAGTVVPVWDSGGGRMAFPAPQPWHPFFRLVNRYCRIGEYAEELATQTHSHPAQVADTWSYQL